NKKPAAGGFFYSDFRYVEFLFYYHNTKSAGLLRGHVIITKPVADNIARGCSGWLGHDAKAGQMNAPLS
ncbi:hypothetical protein, partial [Cronobacter sakazakii]